LIAVGGAAGDDAGPRYIEVRDELDVYTAKLPAFDGAGHWDGWAAVDLEGIAVEVVGGAERPVADVRFSVEPDGSFAHRNNRRVIFLSNSDGEFLARVYVGAAMTAGGAKRGTVYQTAKSILRVEKAGYETKHLLFDFKTPAVKVFMTRAGSGRK
jgi:hypothetical protein